MQLKVILLYTKLSKLLLLLEKVLLLLYDRLKTMMFSMNKVVMFGDLLICLLSIFLKNKYDMESVLKTVSRTIIPHICLTI